MEEKILNVLKNDEYLTTNKVALAVGKNWYKVSYELEKLADKGKVDKLKLSREVGWKLK